jgi:peptidoglycan hydrolase-like protein with peptidoglycan-binding domain
MRAPSRHLLVALLVAVALPSAASARRTLHPGDHNPAVRVLQRALHLHADGIFGPGTRRAVKRFQRSHRLHADGIVGAATWRALTRRSSAARSGGSRGSSVRLLQRRLGISADGVFGPGTKRAVKRFQRAHGLTADGVAGPATWSALGLRGHHPVLKRGRTHAVHRARRHRSGSRGSAVRLLQRRLGIAADGVFGPGTKRALKNFQRAHGLTADGIAGPATWSALGLRGHHPLLRRGRGGRAGGGALGIIARGIAAGNRISRYPYRYGGGHRSFHDSGYDCSGSVSYVLHAMGVLSSPLDSSALMSYGAPGPGRWVTVYANPGHTYMTIRGRRFDTSAQWQGGSRWSIFDRSSSGYVARHPPGL